MRTAAFSLALLLSGAACAQDRTQALRAHSESAAQQWLYSETVSPLDYAPVVVASAWSGEETEGIALQLSIQCRRGRTDLVLASPGLTGRPEAQRVLWSVEDAPPVVLQVAAAPGGAGLAIKDDAPRLLAALPAAGELAIEVTTPQGPALHGRYAMAPLKKVLDRMAAPCKWPTRR